MDQQNKEEEQKTEFEESKSVKEGQENSALTTFLNQFGVWNAKKDEEDESQLSIPKYDEEQTKANLEKITNTIINPVCLNVDHFTSIYSQSNTFKDDEFPSQLSSLTTNESQFPIAKKIVWKKITDLIDPLQIKVFVGEIEPCSLFQGQLGDCYFLSALSTLAEHPSLISRIFETREYNPLGFYSVWLNHDGIWKNIIVDDYFPCVGKIPCFSKSNKKELWVMILEKAYAKIFGCYHNIKLGLPELAVTDLTGSPSERCLTDKEAVAWTFVFNKVEEEKKNHEIKYILNSISKQDESGALEVRSENGIISSHVYSILDAKEIQTDYGVERILKLRNPWGKVEWTGDWSDSSDKWTPQLIEQCKITKKNDGIFWISISDFCKQYASITCNYLHINNYYNATTLDFTNKGRFAFIQLTVTVKGTNGYIQFHQKDKKNYKHLGDQYLYSHVLILIFSGTPSQIGTYIGQGNSILRTGHAKVQFPTAGEYFIAVYAEWMCDITREIVISCYVNNHVYYLGDAIYQEDDHFLDECFLKVPPKQPNQIFIYQEETQAFRYTNSAFGYYFVVFVNESHSTSFSETVSMINLKYLQICPPYLDSHKFEIRIKPKEKRIVKYKILPEGKGFFNAQLKCTSSFHLSSKSLIQQMVKNKSNMKIRKADRDQQQVLFYCFFHSQGIALYYENKTDKIYSEKLQLAIDNLISEDGFDASNPLDIEILPQSQKLIKFQTIDFSTPPTLKYRLIGKQS